MTFMTDTHPVIINGGAGEEGKKHIFNCRLTNKSYCMVHEIPQEAPAFLFFNILHGKNRTQQ